MKKLRLPSLILAIVMVAALMVPALTVLTVAADGTTPPATAPATLPTADTPEWNHPGSGTNYRFPIGMPLDGALVGKPYTMSANLLASSLTVAVQNNSTQQALTPVKAGQSVAGIMLKVENDGSGNNNGLTFGFTSNGKQYAVASNHATIEHYNFQGCYLYDTSYFKGWNLYRDAGSGGGSRAAARTPRNFDGWIFFPLEEMRLLSDQTVTDYYATTVQYAPNNVGADLIAAGISQISVGSTWGALHTVSGAYYVYVDGFDSQADVFPSANVTFFDALNYSLNSETGKYDFSTYESVGLEKNTIFRPGLVAASFTTTKAADAPIDATTEGWTTLQKYEVSAESDFANLDAFMVDVQIGEPGDNNNSSNNPFVAVVVVDGTPYYNLINQNLSSSAYTGHETYFRWEDTAKWYATSGRHYTQGGKPTYGYDRSQRLPIHFNGQVMIPVEHFFQSHPSLENATNSGAGTYARLTNAILDAATTVEFYVGQITWGVTNLTGGQLDLVYAESKANITPTMLPTKQDIMYRSNLRYDSIAAVNNWTYDESQAWKGANAMPEYLWGANITTTTAYSNTAGAATGNIALASLTDALAGKDIRDLAGIFVEYDTTACTYGANTGIWNIGFNISLTAADGRAYTSSALGNGNNHHFVYQGGGGWTVETYNGSNRLVLGQQMISFLPISSFAGTIETTTEKKTIEEVETSFIAAGATFLYEQTNYLAALGGDALTALTLGKANWGEGDAGIAPYITAIKLVWADGFGDAIDADRVPTKFPVNSATYLYENAREYDIANKSTMTDAGFYGNFRPYTFMGTVAENANNKKALDSAFEGKSIVTSSLLTTAEILAQGTTGHTSAVVTSGYGVGYVGKGAQQLNFAVPVGKQAVTGTAAGILLKVDNTADANSKQQGTGIDVGVTLGDGNYYSMFTNGRGTSPATPKTAYRYDYTTDTWMAQIDVSKLRVISGFDGYFFIPFSTMGTYVLDSDGETKIEVMMDMADVIEHGIAQVHVDAYWGGDLVVQSIELASVNVDASEYAISAAPMLGDDISIKFGVDKAFNPYNLAQTITVAVEGKETVELTEQNGAFIYDGLKAQNMTDNIAITLKVGGETVKTVENYSIKTYADNVLNAAGTTDATKTLINALLQYGTAAQMAANYKTDNLPTTLKDFSAVTPVSAHTATGDTVTVSASLNQEINLIISGVEGTLVATITDAEGNVRTLSAKAPEGGKVRIEGIGANELDNVITLSVGETVVKTLSVNNYLAAVAANAGNTSLQITLAKALYEYGVAAAAYAPASYAV